MKICVTGATGMIGSSLVRRLAETRLGTIRAIHRKEFSIRISNVEYLQKDLTSSSDCVDAVGDQDVIVHLAGSGSPLQFGESITQGIVANLFATLNLLEAAKRAGRRPHVVFCSSGGTIYGRSAARVPFKETDACHPLGSYAIQKLAIEHYLATYVAQNDISATILRVSTVFGRLMEAHAMQGFVGIALARGLTGTPIRLIGDPGNVRDYVHVDDVVNAIVLAIGRAGSFDTYNIGSGKGTTVLGVVDAIERAIGRPVATYKEDVGEAHQLVDWSVLDVDKARLELAWRPQVTLEDGLAEMVQSARQTQSFNPGVSKSRFTQR